MLNLAAEGVIGPVRAFGTFTLDDFDLPHERGDGSEKFNSSKPAAMGITAGVEINLLEGKAIEKKNVSPADYALKDDTFKKETGLNVGYELFYCSKFMYNRSESAGKFMVPYQFISFACGTYQYDETAFYLGFKYGSDTMVHRLYAEYTNNPVEAFASVELMNRGSFGINSNYSKDYFNEHLETPYDISAPSVKVLMIKGGASYYVQPGLKANLQIGYTSDLTHKTSAFQATLGGSIAICDVNWKNLF